MKMLWSVLLITVLSTMVGCKSHWERKLGSQYTQEERSFMIILDQHNSCDKFRRVVTGKPQSDEIKTFPESMCRFKLQLDLLTTAKCKARNIGHDDLLKEIGYPTLDEICNPDKKHVGQTVDQIVGEPIKQEGSTRYIEPDLYEHLIKSAEHCKKAETLVQFLGTNLLYSSEESEVSTEAKIRTIIAECQHLRLQAISGLKEPQ